MLLAVAFALGAVFGWYRARRRGGDRLDKLQYAAAHGILFTLVMLAVILIASRFGFA